MVLVAQGYSEQVLANCNHLLGEGLVKLTPAMAGEAVATEAMAHLYLYFHVQNLQDLFLP